MIECKYSCVAVSPLPPSSLSLSPTSPVRQEFCITTFFFPLWSSSSPSSSTCLFTAPVRLSLVESAVLSTVVVEVVIGTEEEDLGFVVDAYGRGAFRYALQREIKTREGSSLFPIFCFVLFYFECAALPVQPLISYTW